MVKVPELFMKFLIVMLIYVLPLFISAGTINWLEAWICLIIAFLGFGGTTIWLYYENPSLLALRAKIMRPSKGWDKLVIYLLLITVILVLSVSGIDYRLKISNVPFLIKTFGLVMLIIAFLIYFLTNRENRYLSKTVEIQDSQKVIDTGIYRVVRHPLYLSICLMIISIPLALGTLLTYTPSLLFIILIIIRIHYEEQVLVEELTDYKNYKKAVRYRLIPWIW